MISIFRRVIEFFRPPYGATMGHVDSPLTRSEALAVIAKHGLDARRYVQTVGSGNDDELWNALLTLQDHRILVFDESGELAGAVTPTDEGFTDKARWQRVRLLVDDS